MNAKVDQEIYETAFIPEWRGQPTTIQIGPVIGITEIGKIIEDQGAVEVVGAETSHFMAQSSNWIIQNRIKEVIVKQIGMKN